MKVSVGDVAQVVFLVDPPVDGVRGERMWVEVTSVGNQTGLGILDNDPVVRTDLSHREEVAFDLCDVIAIFDENSPPDSTQHGRISLDPPKCPYCRCLIDLSDYDQLASGHLVEVVGVLLKHQALLGEEVLSKLQADTVQRDLYVGAHQIANHCV